MTINTQKLLAAHGSIAPLSPMRLERLDVRALQQLDYSGPGSRGKSIYVGANEVLELVAAARALTDAQNALDAQAAEIDRLKAVAQMASDALDNYERMGEVCPFEGQPMIYAETLIEIGEAARAALSQGEPT